MRPIEKGDLRAGGGGRAVKARHAGARASELGRAGKGGRPGSEALQRVLILKYYILLYV